MILLASLLYVSALYTLGVFVSTRTQLASTAITVLLTVWVLMVLIVPNAAPYLAARLEPVRSFVLVEKEKAQVQRDEQQRLDREMDEWAEANPEVPRWQGYEWWSRWTELSLDRLDRLMDGQRKVNEHYHKELGQQIGLAQNLSRLSPLSSFAYAATDLAGTGVRDRTRFMDQLDAHRRELSIFGQQSWLDAAARRDWDSRTIEGYPRFAYEESAVGDRINWPDLLALGMWNILFFMGAYLSFLRYDVK